MSIAILKDKGQITVPADIRRLISAEAGDIFDMRVVDGQIVMTLQRVVPAETVKTANSVDLAKYIGLAKGTYGSVEDIDTYLHNERASWDR